MNSDFYARTLLKLCRSLKVLGHNRNVFVLTFIQRSSSGSVEKLQQALSLLNPRVPFTQTYPDELQGAFESASDAVHAALLAAPDNGFWVGMGVGHLNIPASGDALDDLSIALCDGDALEYSRLAVEQARTGSPARGIAISSAQRFLSDALSGNIRLLYRVCADRTEAEQRVVAPLIPGVRGQQKAVAQALGITTQAVSRALVRARWHEEQAARVLLVDALTRLDVPADGFSTSSIEL